MKEDGFEYAVVTRMLGDMRVEAACLDGVQRTVKIKPEHKGRVWIVPGDLVLVALRGYNTVDKSGDLWVKYTADERRALAALGQVGPAEAAAAAQLSGGDSTDAGFEFAAAAEVDEAAAVEAI